MTAQGSTSGPLYDIYYSVDGVTYTLCPDGDNVSLPTVGSSVVVSVDDTANFRALLDENINNSNRIEFRILFSLSANKFKLTPNV